MPLIDTQLTREAFASNRKPAVLCPRAGASLAGLAAACAITAIGALPAYGATLSRSVDVRGEPSAVWSRIGPFCAIKDWHPAIGACAIDGRTPPTRTLVTKDGKARFVEIETARSAAQHRYSYTFLSSPVPVTHYTSTIEVVAKGQGVSTVTWKSVYTPDPGREKDARDALTGIYESGLAAIGSMFAQ